jgi:hypothetical protein
VNKNQVMTLSLGTQGYHRRHPYWQRPCAAAGE